MPIKPEEIDASSLPVAMRGYQREAVEELLKRVAWDYRQVTRDQARWAEEEQRLKDRIAELEGQPAEQPLPQEAIVTQEESVDEVVQQRTAAFQEEIARLQKELRKYELRDELTKAFLVTAERTAKELRRSARDDAVSILKAAHKRAAEIEQDARKTVSRSSSEVERLRRLEEDLKQQLRSTLQTVLGENGSPVEEPVAHEEPVAEEPAPREPEPEHWPTAGLD